VAVVVVSRVEPLGQVEAATVVMEPLTTRLPQMARLTVVVAAVAAVTLLEPVALAVLAVQES
jgi:hypothetical protein